MPCGSNLKYKKCHLGRELASPVPYHESAKALLRLQAGERRRLPPDARRGAVRRCRDRSAQHFAKRSSIGIARTRRFISLMPIRSR